jgi:hypothetical protein
MKPINRGPAFAQGYGEASSADENGFVLLERQAMRCPYNIARRSPTEA